MRRSYTSQKHKMTMFLLFMMFLLILSVAIMLMPIASAQKETARGLLFLSGACFWSGLIGTVTMAVKINNARKRNHRFKEKYGDLKQCGVVSFFKNKEAKIADITMFASIICFIITKIFADGLYWPFACLALFVFSFGMHCMLNGINYIYLNFKVRREEKS